MRWRNIREVIGSRLSVEPGGVLTSSMYFPLPISDREEVSRLGNLQLVVTDFQGRASVYDLAIMEKWLTARPNVLILNRAFRADGERNVSFV